MEQQRRLARPIGAEHRDALPLARHHVEAAKRHLGSVLIAMLDAADSHDLVRRRRRSGVDVGVRGGRIGHAGSLRNALLSTATRSTAAAARSGIHANGLSTGHHRRQATAATRSDARADDNRHIERARDARLGRHCEPAVVAAQVHHVVRALREVDRVEQHSAKRARDRGCRAERVGADDPGTQADRRERVRELLEQQEQRSVRHQQGVADHRRQDRLHGSEHLRIRRGEHQQHRSQGGADRLGDDQRGREPARRGREGVDGREQRRIGREQEHRTPRQPLLGDHGDQHEREARQRSVRCCWRQRRPARAQTRPAWRTAPPCAARRSPGSPTSRRVRCPLVMRPLVAERCAGRLGDRPVKHEPRSDSGDEPDDECRDDRLDHPADGAEQEDHGGEALHRQLRRRLFAPPAPARRWSRVPR